MNAAIVLIQAEIEALRERDEHILPSFGKLRLRKAIEELGDALDVLRGLDKSTTGR